MNNIDIKYNIDLLKTIYDGIINKKGGSNSMNILFATEVTQAIISAINEKKYSLNITKLQKLLYITYGIYLAKYGKLLFEDDKPCYLPHGPVFLNILKSFRYDTFEGISYNNSNIPKDVSEIIDAVVSTFGQYQARSLVDWLHREDTAWSKLEKKRAKYGEELQEKDIKNEFKELIAE